MFFLIYFSFVTQHVKKENIKSLFTDTTGIIMKNVLSQYKRRKETIVFIIVSVNNGYSFFGSFPLLRSSNIGNCGGVGLGYS